MSYSTNIKEEKKLFDSVNDNIPLSPLSSSSPSDSESLSTSPEDAPSPKSTIRISPKAKKVVKNPTGKRRPRTSPIWSYATQNPSEAVSVNSEGQEVWICALCKEKKTSYLLSGGTAAPIRHLLRVHQIQTPTNGSKHRRSHLKKKNTEKPQASPQQQQQQQTHHHHQQQQQHNHVRLSNSPVTPTMTPAQTVSSSSSSNTPNYSNIPNMNRLMSTPLAYFPNGVLTPSAPFASRPQRAHSIVTPSSSEVLASLSTNMNMQLTPVSDEQSSVPQSYSVFPPTPTTPISGQEMFANNASMGGLMTPFNFAAQVSANKANKQLLPSPVLTRESGQADIIASPITKSSSISSSSSVNSTPSSLNENANSALFDVLLKYDVPASAVGTSKFREFCAAVSPEAALAINNSLQFIQQPSTPPQEESLYFHNESHAENESADQDVDNEATMAPAPPQFVVSHSAQYTYYPSTPAQLMVSNPEALEDGWYYPGLDSPQVISSATVSPASTSNTNTSSSSFDSDQVVTFPFNNEKLTTLNNQQSFLVSNSSVFGIDETSFIAPLSFSSNNQMPVGFFPVVEW